MELWQTRMIAAYFAAGMAALDSAVDAFTLTELTTVTQRVT